MPRSICLILTCLSMAMATGSFMGCAPPPSGNSNSTPNDNSQPANDNQGTGNANDGGVNGNDDGGVNTNDNITPPANDNGGTTTNDNDNNDDGIDRGNENGNANLNDNTGENENTNDNAGDNENMNDNAGDNENMNDNAGDNANDNSADDGGGPVEVPPTCTTDEECDDANLCTDDACIDGACDNTPVVTCAVQSSCDPATGRCVTTTRVSLSTDEEEPNHQSNWASVSANGRFVAFRGNADNLVDNDTNDVNDVFLRDRQLGTTVRISVTSNGEQGDLGSSRPSITPDGRFIVFNSEATNLVTGDTNQFRDIFVRDRNTNQTTRVSVATGGAQANGHSDFPSISSDGRYVSFSSEATNLVAGDTNGAIDIFVHDRQTGTTRRVSVSSSGVQLVDPDTANELGFDGANSISPDGRFVAFSSDAANLVAADTNGVYDVFVHDRDSDEDGVFDEAGGIRTTRVSINSDGEQADDQSFVTIHGLAISAGGRYVVFDSDATNLVDDDTNGYGDVFVHDRQTGDTVRMSVSRLGRNGNDSSFWGSMSQNGRYVAFRSSADNLVVIPAGLRNIYVRDRDPDGNGIFDEGNGVTSLVSVNAQGQAGNLGLDPENDFLDGSDFPFVSSGGRYVAFRSWATNLVPNDTNLFRDAFLHDRGQE